jgi:hypothetical protein
LTAEALAFVAAIAVPGVTRIAEAAHSSTLVR